MFKDYYAILEINEYATVGEIKIAFRRLAKKWHPDRNPGMDTTKMMQDINEAYLILKDSDARIKYNTEYLKFKQFRKEKQGWQERKQAPAFNGDERSKERRYEYSDYEIFDQTLERWMKNAARQAIDLAQITIKETGMLMGEGIKAAGNEMVKYLIPTLIVMIISLIILAIYVSRV